MIVIIITTNEKWRKENGTSSLKSIKEKDMLQYYNDPTKVTDVHRSDVLYCDLRLFNSMKCKGLHY